MKLPNLALVIVAQAVVTHAGQHWIDRNNDGCLMWTAPKASAAHVRGRWLVLPR